MATKKAKSSKNAVKKAVVTIYERYGKDAFVKMGKKASETRKKNAQTKKRSAAAHKAHATRRRNISKVGDKVVGGCNVSQSVINCMVSSLCDAFGEKSVKMALRARVAK